MMSRGARIFVSYSHEDVPSLRRLQTVLSPAIQNGCFDCWDDRRIGAGAEWRREDALASADVAVLLVSMDFLASDFITRLELPAVLQARRDRGLKVLWIPVGPALFDHTALAEIQAAIDPKRPLSRMAKAKRECLWAEIAMKIVAAAAESRRESAG